MDYEFILTWNYILQKHAPEVFYMKNGALLNFIKFTGKHLFQGLLFNKAAGLGTATLLKKKLRRRCFPLNLAKFLRTPYLQNASARLQIQKEPCILAVMQF